MNRKFTLYICLATLVITTAGCVNSPIQRLRQRLIENPQRMIAGTWVGRFKLHDPKVLDRLRRSINKGDNALRQQLIRRQRETPYFRFYTDGTVDFVDSGRTRKLAGRWEVAGIEGRTAVVNIATASQYTTQKPLIFLHENALIVRPPLNGDPHGQYGQVVFWRAYNQSSERKNEEEAQDELTDDVLAG